MTLFVCTLIIIHTRQVTNDNLTKRAAKIESIYVSKQDLLDTKVQIAKEALSTPDRVTIDRSTSRCGKTKIIRKEDYGRSKSRLKNAIKYRDSMMSIYSREKQVELNKINSKLSPALSMSRFSKLLRPFMAFRPYLSLIFMILLVLIFFFYRTS